MRPSTDDETWLAILRQRRERLLARLNLLAGGGDATPLCLAVMRIDRMIHSLETRAPVRESEPIIQRDG